jgi:hypothetical protein
MLLDCTWNNAHVSGQVASHARHRPLFYGTNVTQSGHFPPLAHRENGYHVDSVSVRVEAWHSKSLVINTYHTNKLEYCRPQLQEVIKIKDD